MREFPRVKDATICPYCGNLAMPHRIKETAWKSYSVGVIDYRPFPRGYIVYGSKVVELAEGGKTVYLDDDRIWRFGDFGQVVEKLSHNRYMLPEGEGLNYGERIPDKVE